MKFFPIWYACQVWVKFGTTDVQKYIRVLSGFEFRKTSAVKTMLYLGAQFNFCPAFQKCCLRWVKSIIVCLTSVSFMHICADRPYCWTLHVYREILWHFESGCILVQSGYCVTEYRILSCVTIWYGGRHLTFNCGGNVFWNMFACTAVITMFTVLHLFMVGSFCPLFCVFRLHSLGSNFSDYTN